MTDDIQRNLKRAAYCTALIFALALTVGLFFETQIALFSERLLHRVSVPTLGFLIAINDLIVSPVPPDVLLLVISKTENASSQVPFVAFLGLCSSLGGLTAWFLARRFGNPIWLGKTFQNTISTHHQSVNKYGKLAVALGALTPLPFSVVCWISGFVKMDFKDFFPMALLRVPRFILYYLILTSSSEISGWIKSFF